MKILINKKTIALFTILLLTFNTFAKKKDFSPDILWEVKLNKMGYPDNSQDLKNPYYSVYEYDKNKYNHLKINPDDGKIIEKKEFSFDKGDLSLYLTQYGKYLIKPKENTNGLFLINGLDYLEISNYETGKNFFIKSEGVTIKSYYVIEEKDIILIDRQKIAGTNRLTAYNLLNQKIIYDIEYTLYRNQDDRRNRYEVFKDENRIIIYEEGKNIGVYSLENGKKINTIKDVLNDDSIYSTSYYPDKAHSLLFVSSTPNALYQINLMKGELVNKKEYGSKVAMKDYNYYFIDNKLFIHYYTFNSIGFFCFNFESLEPVWEKSYNSKKYDYKIINNSFLISDTKYLYLVDAGSGKEIWKASVPLENIIMSNKDNIFVFQNKNKLIFLDIVTGNIIKEIMSSSDLNVFNFYNDILLTSNKDTIFELDAKTGEIKKEINLSKIIKQDKITGVFNFQGYQNLIIIQQNSISLFDEKENKIIKKFNLLDEYKLAYLGYKKNYLFCFFIEEFKMMGQSLGGGATKLYLFDLGNKEFLWKIKIGNFQSSIENAFNYINENGFVVSPEYSVFSEPVYPYQFYLDKNLLITPNYTDGFTKMSVVGYKVFKEKVDFSNDDINNMEWQVGFNKY